MRVVVHTPLNYLSQGASLINALEILGSLFRTLEGCHGVSTDALLHKTGKASKRLRAARNELFKEITRLLDGDRGAAAELLGWLTALPATGIERRLDAALRS